MMEDDGGGDEKIIAVPVPQAHPAYEKVHELHRPSRDRGGADRAFLRSLQGSGARQVGQDRSWGSVDEAQRLIVEAIERGAAAKAK